MAVEHEDQGWRRLCQLSSGLSHTCSSPGTPVRALMMSPCSVGCHWPSDLCSSCHSHGGDESGPEMTWFVCVLNKVLTEGVCVCEYLDFFQSERCENFRLTSGQTDFRLQGRLTRKYSPHQTGWKPVLQVSCSDCLQNTVLQVSSWVSSTALSRRQVKSNVQYKHFTFIVKRHIGHLIKM